MNMHIKDYRLINKWVKYDKSQQFENKAENLTFGNLDYRFT